MKIKKLIGFMLSETLRTHHDSWCPDDKMVYVPRTLNAACEIAQSDDRINWKYIYRVQGTDIECLKKSENLVWTTQSSRLIVTDLIDNVPRRALTMDEMNLLTRFRNFRRDLFELNQGLSL